MMAVAERGRYAVRMLRDDLAAFLPLFGGAAGAADFYQGKQVTIVVGFTAGGTYDATARLFARHLGKHLPGKPTVIVRNMPGAGSLVATMSLYGSLPKDGTALGVVGGGVVLEPLLGNPQATYDPRRFNWIGGRTRDHFLCLVWHTVPVHTLQDATKRETVMGATGPGSRTMTYPKALNELVGTKFKIVSGYPGGNEITLALERGEVEGYCGWALGSIKTRAPDWLRDGKIRPLAQFTLSKAADLPNVPLASDLAGTDRPAGRSSFFRPIPCWPGRWWRRRTCRRSAWVSCAPPSMRCCRIRSCSPRLRARASISIR